MPDPGSSDPGLIGFSERAPAPDADKLPWYRKNPRVFYWYNYLADSQTVYLQYNSCLNRPGRPFPDFSREVLEFVKANDVRKIVLDLRLNGGGNSMIFTPLIQGLAKLEKINQRGRIFVIIGRRTFSSAILNALDLKKSTQALFYGEPTGGKPNHYGEIKSFVLPYSKLAVSYSTKYFQHAEGDDVSLMPDVVIELGLGDYRDLRDPVLEAILAAGTGDGPETGRPAGEDVPGLDSGRRRADDEERNETVVFGGWGADERYFRHAWDREAGALKEGLIYK